MRLFRWFILRYLRLNVARVAVTVLGIALGVAVVVAVQLANGSALAGFERALETMSGRTSLEIVGSGLGLDESRLTGLEWLNDYGTVSPVIEGDAVFIPTGRRGTEMLRVLGVDILRDRSLRDYVLRDRLASGSSTGATSESVFPLTSSAVVDAPSATHLLSLLLSPDSVILTERFARRGGLRVGDRIRVGVGDSERTWVIRGLLGDAGPARVLDGNVAVMDIAAAQWAFDRLGRLDRLDLRLDDPDAVDQLERDIGSRLPSGLHVQRPARRGRQVENMLRAFHANLTALSYVALLVGLFLVYNTVSTSVIRRRDEIGTLRALGVTRGHVLWLFMTEAIAMAVPGCLLGLALGQGLSYLAVELTRTTVRALYIANAAAPPALSWAQAFSAVAVALPLAVVAALLPATEASRVSPIAAIRGGDRLETRFRLRRWRLVLPAGLFALAGYWATRDAVGGLPLWGYASALAVVFGAAFLTPVLLFVATRALRLGGRALFRVDVWLAVTNVAAAIPRLSVSVAALSVALAMTVAIAIMVGSFRETVIYWVGETIRADLFIGPASRNNGSRQSTLSPDVLARIAAHPMVEDVYRFRMTSVPYEDGQVFLTSGDLDVVRSRRTLLFKSPADGIGALSGAEAADVVAVSEAYAVRYAKRVGDSVSLTTLGGVVDFRIVAIFYDYGSDRGQVLMDTATFARHFGRLNPTGLSVYLRAGAHPEAVRQEILTGLGDDARIFVYTNRALRDEVLRIFDSTFAITYALEIIAVVVAILGVGATLVTLVLERRRELAVLRLVGTDRHQVRRMVVSEAAVIGGVAQVIGLGVGVALSLILIYVINYQSFGWTIQFHAPILFLGQMACLVMVATALAGLYPARMAAGFVVASEVSEE